MTKLVTLFCAAFLISSGVKAEGLSEVQLGQVLFFDPAFSVNGTMSCATCHVPDQGFTDHRLNRGKGFVSLGDDGHALGSRNTPMAAYANTSPDFHFDEALEEYVGGQFWDGRANTLADQALGPPLNPVEMGLSSDQQVVEKLQQNPLYKATFERLYGSNIFASKALKKGQVAPAYAAFGKALQAFEETAAFSSYDSKYDRFLKGEYQLTVLEDLGRTLFFSNNNVNCNSCHMLKTEDSEKEPFTNHQYRNIGVPANPNLLKLGHLGSDFVDHGLLENPAVTDPKYDGKFKTPSLRNVAVTAPYMHNGVFKDLRTVVAFYDHYNNPKHSLNPETGKPWAEPEVPATVDKEELKAHALSERKIDALVAFMKTLTDKRYEPLLEAPQQPALKK
ncbi:cytochrome-c peroxidase [Marinomonas pollencensis]|uniref:Cytochrome c peroxidase n=1 Tax=Marinomonas pollencensis TaxID=491954 RepID=A0A3E0DSY4_9GAMM|nr:cytochrome c peroxidase [Marinomonas pollencensis]REG86669.1 cytochrome c peroxidase [Marinomonas pollencensis]